MDHLPRTPSLLYAGAPGPLRSAAFARAGSERWRILWQEELTQNFAAGGFLSSSPDLRADIVAASMPETCLALIRWWLDNVHAGFG